MEVRRFSGTYIPAPYESHGGSVTIKFQSDGSVTSWGFQLRYRRKPISTQLMSQKLVFAVHGLMQEVNTRIILKLQFKNKRFVVQKKIRIKAIT